MLEALGLGEFHKIQATNAIKEAFPGTETQRRGPRNNRVVYYKDLGYKSHLAAAQPQVEDYPPSSSPQSPDEGSEIGNIKKLISLAKDQLSSINARIDEKLSNDNVEMQTDIFKALLSRQENLHKKVEDLNNIFINLLQKEVSCLIAEQSQYTMLHSSEAQQINKEIDVFVGYLDTNLEKRTDFGAIFTDLTKRVEKAHCCLML